MWLIRELVFFVKVMLNVKRRQPPQWEYGLDRSKKPESMKGCKL